MCCDIDLSWTYLRLMKPHIERETRSTKLLRWTDSFDLLSCYHGNNLSGQLMDECWGLRIYARTHNMSFTQEEKCWPPCHDTHIYHCHVRTLQYYDIQITRLFQTYPSLLLQPLRPDDEEDRWDQSSIEHRTACTTMRTFLFFTAARRDILYTTKQPNLLVN